MFSQLLAIKIPLRHVSQFSLLQKMVMIHCSEDQLTYFCVILSETLNIVTWYILDSMMACWSYGFAMIQFKVKVMALFLYSQTSQDTDIRLRWRVAFSVFMSHSKWSRLLSLSGLSVVTRLDIHPFLIKPFRQNIRECRSILHITN